MPRSVAIGLGWILSMLGLGALVLVAHRLQIETGGLTHAPWSLETWLLWAAGGGVILSAIGVWMRWRWGTPELRVARAAVPDVAIAGIAAATLAMPRSGVSESLVPTPTLALALALALAIVLVVARPIASSRDVARRIALVPIATAPWIGMVVLGFAAFWRFDPGDHFTPGGARIERADAYTEAVDGHWSGDARIGLTIALGAVLALALLEAARAGRRPSRSGALLGLIAAAPLVALDVVLALGGEGDAARPRWAAATVLALVAPFAGALVSGEARPGALVSPALASRAAIATLASATIGAMMVALDVDSIAPISASAWGEGDAVATALARPMPEGWDDPPVAIWAAPALALAALASLAARALAGELTLRARLRALAAVLALPWLGLVLLVARHQGAVEVARWLRDDPRIAAIRSCLEADPSLSFPRVVPSGAGGVPADVDLVCLAPGLARAPGRAVEAHGRVAIGDAMRRLAAERSVAILADVRTPAHEVLAASGEALAGGARDVWIVALDVGVRGVPIAGCEPGDVQVELRAQGAFTVRDRSGTPIAPRAAMAEGCGDDAVVLTALARTIGEALGGSGRGVCFDTADADPPATHDDLVEALVACDEVRRRAEPRVPLP